MRKSNSLLWPLLVARMICTVLPAGATEEWQIVSPDTTLRDVSRVLVQPGELLLLNPYSPDLLPMVERLGGVQARGIALSGVAIDRLSGEHLFLSIDSDWDIWKTNDVIRCEFSGSNCTPVMIGEAAGIPEGVKISAIATQVVGGVQNLYVSFDTTFRIGSTVFRPSDLARWTGSTLVMALPHGASGTVAHWSVTGASLRPDTSWQLAFDTGGQMPFPGSLRFFTSDILRANPTVNAHALRLRARSLDWEGAKVTAFDALDSGLVQFDSFSVIVNHGTNPVTLTVRRTDGSEGLIRMSYATIAGSAQPGVDYAFTQGVLTWNHGDATDRQIQIPILNTTGSGIDKSFSVLLFPDNQWALPGNPAETTLTIPNQDVLFRDDFE
ncbi:MAG: hypothetical protein Kow0020_05810 [Wenzhouxiangellaceae bacterium]